MAAVVPHARILVVLRNPVDRFYSEYVCMCVWRVCVCVYVRVCVACVCGVCVACVYV
jgi:hypothetical protein